MHWQRKNNLVKAMKLRSKKLFLLHLFINWFSYLFQRLIKIAVFNMESRDTDKDQNISSFCYSKIFF